MGAKRKKQLILIVDSGKQRLYESSSTKAGLDKWKADGENISSSGIQLEQNHKLCKAENELRDFKFLRGDGP